MRKGPTPLVVVYLVCMRRTHSIREPGWGPPRRAIVRVTDRVDVDMYGSGNSLWKWDMRGSELDVWRSTMQIHTYTLLHSRCDAMLARWPFRMTPAALTACNMDVMP